MIRVGLISGGNPTILEPTDSTGCRQVQLRTRSSETAWRGAPNKSRQGEMLRQSQKYDEKVKKASCAASSPPTPEFFSMNSANAENRACVPEYGAGFEGRCRINLSPAVGTYRRPPNPNSSETTDCFPF